MLRRNGAGRRPPPAPFILGSTEAFYDGVAQDVPPFIGQLSFVPNSMVEKVRLPRNSYRTRGVALPAADCFCQLSIAWDREEGMKVVRHDEDQTTVPSTLGVIVFGRGDQPLGKRRIRQLHRPRGTGSNPDMKYRIRFHPVRNCVMQTPRPIRVWCHESSV
jgi:hypothetical protein